MRFSTLATALVTAVAAVTKASSPGTEGLINLVKRRIPAHGDNFEFVLSENLSSDSAGYDGYIVSMPIDGHVRVESVSISGLASGLYRYLSDVVKVDIYWFIGSRLHLAPDELPRINGSLSGASTVPYRYHFNTVTFSYTTAFWNWTDWELELDWLALRGVNLPLAWVGVERIIYDVFHETGLTHAEISSFFSGPAFQAWNRFGNIQGSWPQGSELPMSWIDGQFALQKQIVRRMVELGMTPVLPSFTGFVPRDMSRVLPNATFVNGSQWSGFPSEYTNVTFLEPFDPAFAALQKSFIDKQTAAYGSNVSHIYTLDQYNENDPLSGDLDYLRNVSYGTWKALKAADPQAVWLMQGWLFFAKSDFWTSERVEAYLSGVEDNTDMLILDLFSESQPQWQRTRSYYGKRWIWCQLHNFGGGMALHGQVKNVTVNPVEALANSSSLVGYGLTMEGQEGNEIIYSLLLSQAWSRNPINTEQYFRSWVARRYNSGNGSTLPTDLFAAWGILRTTVYNSNFTSIGALKSLFELRPSLTGLTGRAGFYLTDPPYDPSDLLSAWKYFLSAALASPELWSNPAFMFDAVDFTRQVLANTFATQYADLVATFNASVSNFTTGTNGTAGAETVAEKGKKLTDLLAMLDRVLSASRHFSLGPWIEAARAWAQTPSSVGSDTIIAGDGYGGEGNFSSVADFFEYNARNQVTLWGPQGEISGYASKAWEGLVRSYYAERWRIFVDYLVSALETGDGASEYNASVLAERLFAFELAWQVARWEDDRSTDEDTNQKIQDILGAESVL
ncbi:Alpha-N-acetylglucosaminidase [Neofusicoccum parvum]|nr:Alpha-N-acetylglucosaminidase [Neofusicoccum parvum]